ncbi:MAG: TIGR04255 family protein [Betaproteobacteria bacterium]|nr:TIGR04255 family protein [Betaproteobacteria bacterium]
MTAIPKRLKIEPLIEAIWQVQFEPTNNQPIGDLLPGVLYPKLQADHPQLQLQRLPVADIPAQVAQIDPNLLYAAKYRIKEPDSPFMFQVGDRIITLNCLRPYAGWAAFKEKILSLVRIIESSPLVPVPLRHSLRYIDLLTQEPAPSLSSLQLSLKLGAFDIQAQPLQTRVELQDGTCTHVVQIATPARIKLREGMKEGAIVDLETFFTDNPKDWDAIAAQIDHLHERSKVLFFEHILTEQAIAQMGPEY